MMKNALIIGCSDGVGSGLVAQLLQQDWKVYGLSRSKSNIENNLYSHSIIDVQEDDYPQLLDSTLKSIKTLDLCVYCAGIGELLDVNNMHEEVKVIEVNLLGMVKTASCVIPKMVNQEFGHFMGLSSVGDELLSVDGPSYHASKAGFSNYLEGLGLALKPRGIYVTNVRFGFVDTKMAKGDVKPFMISVDDAVDHLMKCLEKKPIRYTAPRIVVPMVKFRRWIQTFELR